MGPEHEKILPERQQAGNHDARQQRHQHRSAGIQALQPLHVANGVIVAKFRGQRKGGLDAEHTKQPGDHAGKPPLRHGHAIGHERADQQDRQIEQGQVGGARHRKRNGLAKLADNPAPRRCHARLAQIRKQPRSVDCQKPDRGDHLRGDVSEGDGQQATRRDDCDKLGELPDENGGVLHLHRASIEPSRAVQRGNEIGRHCPQHSRSHDDECRIEMRNRGKSKHRGRRQHCRPHQQRQGQRRNETEVNPQHRAVEPRGAAVAVGARLELKKPVDRAELQAGIRDESEIADGIDRKPRRQRVTRPVVQEDRNESDLLGDTQNHLEQVC